MHVYNLRGSNFHVVQLHILGHNRACDRRLHFGSEQIADAWYSLMACAVATGFAYVGVQTGGSEFVYFFNDE